MLKIKKHYEENLQIGPFQHIKIGLTIESDKELTTSEEVEKYSGSLAHFAKTLVRKEIQQMKEEKEVKKQQEEKEHIFGRETQE